VLAIVGLAFVVILPNFANLFQITLASLARDIQLEMRQSRSQAVTRQEATLFWVDPAVGEYGVGSEVLGRIPERIGVTVTGAELARREGRAGFLFFPDGSSTGGSLTLSEDDVALVVEVDWLTGRIGSREELR